MELLFAEVTRMHGVTARRWRSSQVEMFYAALLDRLSRTPGISAVSAGSTMPMASGAGVWDFEVEGRPAPGPGQPAWNAGAVIALHGYFETLGVLILRGRSFTDEDHGRSRSVTIISQSMAARYFPGEDPIGKRIRVKGRTSPEAWMSIVGVSGDVRTEGLRGGCATGVSLPPHSQLLGILGDTAARCR